MLEDLKRERQAGLSNQDRTRLTLYIMALLAIGIAIVAGQTCQTATRESGNSEAEPETAPTRPVPPVDRALLARLVAESGREPHLYAPTAVEQARQLERAGSLAGPYTQPSAVALAAAEFEQVRGTLVEMRGRVLDLGAESWPPDGGMDSERIWSVVLEGPDGGRFVALRVARRSDREEGRPRDTQALGSVSEPIAPGQDVKVRGLVLQQRTGSLGQTALGEPTPVIYATRFRIGRPPEELLSPIQSLEECSWDQVRDRYLGESLRWDEPAVFEIVQWARTLGLEKVRAALASGEIPWQDWDENTFDTWRKEVRSVEEGGRPFTEGARGKVFRLGGIIGETLHLGWEEIAPNGWDVDELDLLVMITDDYGYSALRTINPFPISAFASQGITGAREEHIRIYGVFVKNYTYETKFDMQDHSGRKRPLTVPLFVVLDVDLYPEGAAAAELRQFMVWVAGAMVVLGLLFWVLLSRSDKRQAARMEEQRARIRRRSRAAVAGQDAPPAQAGSGDEPAS